MLRAVTFEEILDRAEAFGRGRELCDRLVSIVFANERSPVWSDLTSNRAFLDSRSGESWDLFFAGLSGYGPMPKDRDRAQRLFMKSRKYSDEVIESPYFNPTYFTEIEQLVSREHAQAVEGSSEHGPWRYSGGTDLVSFMVYGRNPDWLSLRAVRLYSVSGRPVDLFEAVEGLARWQEEILDDYLAPGGFPYVQEGARGLVRGLSWSAEAITAGVLGNAAFELLKRVLSN